MRNRHFFLIAALTVLVLLGAGCTQTYVLQDGRYVEAEKTQGTEAAVDVTLRITKDAAVTAIYALENLQDRTVFGALQLAAEQYGFALSYDPPADLGVFITAIDGVGNTNERFWQFSVNDQYGKVAADKAPLQEGDTVEWKYEKDQFSE